MGSSQTKLKSSSPSEKVVEGLKEKVRVLQGEMNEIMCVRETERQVYERELMVFAFKQAEWKRERKRLKEEVKKCRKILEEKQERLRCMENCGSYDCEMEFMPQNPSCCNIYISDQINEEQARTRRDETLEKWKQLYFAIKVELDDLIQRTRQEERLCWKTEEEDVLLELKQELTTKEERIELLQAKLASMEHQELKREREMDILRQSLRIMSHKRRATKLQQRPIREF